jgi:hypothetical protein
MKWFVAVCLIASAAQLGGQDKARVDRLESATESRPPVLRGGEPSDSGIVSLPGMSAPLAMSAPAAPPDPDDHRPLLRRAPKPVFPAEFARDAAAFAQKFVGLWSDGDACNLFGEPLRERVVIDDGESQNGRIFAYSDPTGHYREIELDFARDTGLLRTVFAYPWKMTWTECLRLWGANVQSTQANKGRIFYSYVNRRLDVLVDPAGKVISLGLY